MKSGDLLSRLDSADYRQQVDVDEATRLVRDRQLALGLAGSRVQDIEAARQSIVDAQADLDQKKKDFGRYDALYKLDEITGQIRDQAATAVTRAQATLERAQQIYDELVEGTRKEELDVDRSNVRQARQNLEMSRIRLSYTVLRAPFYWRCLDSAGRTGRGRIARYSHRDAGGSGSYLAPRVSPGNGPWQSALGTRCRHSD